MEFMPEHAPLVALLFLGSGFALLLNRALRHRTREQLLPQEDPLRPHAGDNGDSSKSSAGQRSSHAPQWQMTGPILLVLELSLALWSIGLRIAFAPHFL